MFGIINITFEKNSKSLNILNICVDNKSSILYKEDLKTIDDMVVLNYLESFSCIVDGSEMEYIDTKLIEGDYCNLSITYIDGSKKEYSGKVNYPVNFEAFESLNQKLINEV